MKRIAAAIAAVLLLAGCSAPGDPAATAAPHGASGHDHATMHSAAPAVPDPGFIEPPPNGGGVFTTLCTTTHHAKDDPLVLPGQPGKAHRHAFAGTTNPNVDAYTTIDTIMGHGTTCGRPEDESAYWSPVLKRNAVPVVPEKALIYYRHGGHQPLDAIQPMPAGLVMIAGNPFATTPQDFGITSWGCGGTPVNEDTALADIPASCEGFPLKLKVYFPSCWDGVNVDSPDHRSHVAYPWADDGERGDCPATHPVPIAELEVAFRWLNLEDNHEGLTLTSGNQYSAHADFMNGWSPEKMQFLTEQCLRTGVKCGTLTGVDPPPV